MQGLSSIGVLKFISCFQIEENVPENDSIDCDFIKHIEEDRDMINMVDSLSSVLA